MKSQLLIILLACFLGVGSLLAQKPHPKKAAVLKSIQANSQLSNSFKEMAKKAYLIDDSLWYAKKPQNITLYKNKALALEKAIEAGEGKQFLEKKLVATARKKHPGNSAKSVRKRFGFYIKQMERVHEDE